MLTSVLAALVLMVAVMLRRFLHRDDSPRGCRPTPAPVVYLEGNIGAGKSTLAASLARLPGFQVLAEPVREWQDVEGANLLEMLYADRPTWSFPFQVLALATLGRRETTLLADTTQTDRVTVMERSPECSLRVFAQDLEDTGILRREHMAILRLVRAAVAPPPCRPVHYVYVRTPPAQAHARMHRRGRAEEARVTLDYLSRLHRLTETWLLSREAAPVHVLDGTLPPAQLLDAATTLLQRIAAARPAPHPRGDEE